jgi:Flp pilus assembly pilin Flp
VNRDSDRAPVFARGKKSRVGELLHSAAASRDALSRHRWKRANGKPAKEEGKMIKDAIKRLYSEEEGMEMVEWAIVAIFFAIVGTAAWGQVSTSIENALTGVANTIDNQAP